MKTLSSQNIHRHAGLRLALFVLISALSLNSCTDLFSLLKVVNIREPSATIQSVQITGLDLSKVDLRFDISVNNPNSVGIRLSNLDYELLIDNASLIKGTQHEPVDIKARDKALMHIPFSLPFSDIRKIIAGLSKQDSIIYQLDLKLGVTLPVLGTVQIPLSRKGSFPNLKKPEIRLQDIHLNNLSFGGANLTIDINITNPNTFGFSTEQLNYALKVNQHLWLRGILEKPVRISAKGKQTVSFPVTLNFLEMGSAVYQLITEGKNLNYELSGQTNIKSDLSFIRTFKVPFTKTGIIKISK